MGNDVTFDIVARDRASQTFSKVGKSAKASESSLSKFGDTAKKVFAAAAIYQGAKLATKGLLGLAKAAAEDQQSVALMAKQFRNSAHATREQIAATEEWITKQGLAKGVADDELRPALSNLVAATHDVGKAQRLTALAMDIAAAKGKPLSAVSMALSKAYNGNVGALGRLGLKTKDAAGKTLSFAQAKKDLNKQFGGAADTKAKTFAGVMDRFKVAVNEAGESIGYKLLPYLTRVVPRVAEFVTGMASGTGKGGEFAATVKQQVIPVVKNLAIQAQLLGGAMMPVLQILSKLPPQVVAAGGAIGFLGPKLGSLRAPLEDTASRMQRMGRMGASLAGGAGLLAVADSANRADQQLAGLQGALGGAAAGMAMGGPIGALIGGAAGGLLGVFSSGKKAAKGIDAAKIAAQKSKQDIDELTSSLNETTGAYTRMAKKMVEDDLRKAGAFEAGAELGLSMRTITSAALGVPSAIAKVQAAVNKANGTFNKTTTSVDAFGNVIISNGQEYQRARGAASSLSRAIDGVGATTKAARKKLIETQLSVGRLGKVMQGVPDAKVIKIGTTGGPKAKNEIIDLASRGKGLSDKQIKMLLKVARLPATLADIAAVKRAADKAAGSRTLKFNIKVTKNTNASIAELAALGDGSGNGRQIAGKAAKTWMDAIVASVTKGTPKVKKAIERAKALFSALGEKISSLKEARSGFTSAFSSDSIFGADMETSGSLAGLLQFQQQQANNATQLLQDIQSVTSKGLSKGLVKQLQSAGSAGAAQLHLLAGASAEQIAQFNNLDKQTSAANSAAGLTLGNYGRGGDIDADIRKAQEQQAFVKAIETALGKMKLEVKVKGGDLIVAVRTTNNNRGRRPGDFTS